MFDTEYISNRHNRNDLEISFMANISSLRFPEELVNICNLHVIYVIIKVNLRTNFM